MSEKHDIDQLFQAKLAHREEAYSAVAWQQSSAMLDTHFRWLFVKKVLWVLIPVLAASGILITTVVDSKLEDQNTAIDQINLISNQSISSSESTAPAKTFEQTSTVETQDALDESLNQLSSASTETVTAKGLTEATSEAVLETKSAPAPKGASAVARTSSGKKKSSTPTKAYIPLPPGLDDLLEDSSPSVASTAADRRFNAIKSGQTVSAISTAEQSKTSRLASMPIFSISALHTSQGGIKVTPEAISDPAMEHLRKVQVMGEFGVLVARGFHDLSGNRMHPSMGVHGQILTKYQINQTLYLDLGLGIFNRGSLTKNVPFSGATAGRSVQVTPVSANYASIYFGTGYRVGSRHSIGGGIQLNPMIGVVAKKEKFQLGESASSSEYLVDNNGFLNLDAAVVLNYRVSFSERWDATAATQIGFFDVTDNEAFKTGDISDYNTLLKLGLSYRLTSR